MSQPQTPTRVTPNPTTSHPSQYARTCKLSKPPTRPTPQLKILRKIGNGCFGFVFEALAIYRNNSRVAWKRMHKNSERVSRELEMLELVKGKKHCVQLLDFFYTRSQGRPNELIQNFIMEYCQDNLESLLAMIKSGVLELSFHDIKKIVFQILLGVKELHSLSICHRDLKPENIFYTNKNVVKIGDLGSSKRLRNFDGNTPYVVSRYYRPPELIIGIKTYSLNIDVFSVGVMFYELVMQRLPFKGRSEGQQLIEIFKNLGCPTRSVRRAYKTLTGWHHKFKSLKLFNRSYVNDKSKEGPTPNWGSKAYCDFPENDQPITFPSQNNKKPQNKSGKTGKKLSGESAKQEIFINRQDQSQISCGTNAKSSRDNSEIESVLDSKDLEDPPVKRLFLECRKEIMKKKTISPIWTEDFELLFRIQGNFKVFTNLEKKMKNKISPKEIELFKK